MPQYYHISKIRRSYGVQSYFNWRRRDTLVQLYKIIYPNNLTACSPITFAWCLRPTHVFAMSVSETPCSQYKSIFKIIFNTSRKGKKQAASKSEENAKTSGIQSLSEVLCISPYDAEVDRSLFFWCSGWLNYCLFWEIY